MIIKVRADQENQPDFIPLSSSEMKNILSMIYTENPDAYSTSNSFSLDLNSGKMESTISSIDNTKQIISIFNTGYWLVTGESPLSLIPSVLPKSEWPSTVKDIASGYCCEQKNTKIQFIADRNGSVTEVIDTLAHESGHARQTLLRPGQIYSERVDFSEALAYLMQASIIRALGEYTGLNTTGIPSNLVISTGQQQFKIEEYLFKWAHDLKSLETTGNGDHERAKYFLWLTLLYEPEFSEYKNKILQSKATYLNSTELYDIYSFLLKKDTSQISSYTDKMLNKISEIENLLTGTLDKRVGSRIKYEGFITGTGWETAVLIP